MMLRVLTLALAAAAARACYPDGWSADQRQVTAGDPTWVCLYAENDVNGTMRVPFELEADEYSRLTIADSWTSSLAANTPSYIYVSSGDQYSWKKKMFRSEDGFTTPLFTAIVSVEDGEITSVTWDDGCHFCDETSSDCVANQYKWDNVTTQYDPSTKTDCVVADSDCYYNGEPNELCELNVYVVWSGTDKNGDYFHSAALRFSRFRSMSVDSYINDAQDAYAASDHVSI